MSGGRSTVPGPAALEFPGRYVAAALSLLVAVAHLLVIEDHVDRAPYLGLLSGLVVLGSLAGTGLLAWRDTRPSWLLAGAAAGIAVVVFLVDRVVDLPPHDDDLGSRTEPVGLLTVLMALGVVGLSGWALGRGRATAPTPPPTPLLVPPAGPTRRRAGTRSQLIGGLIALQIGGAATFAAASMSPQLGTPPAGLPAAAQAGATDTSAYWSAVGGAGFTPSGVTRTYYIASVETVWDYAPTGKNGISGEPFGDTEKTYLQTGPGRVGAKNLKCLYRQYTDASFATKQPRPADQAYLGLYGPVIRAAVGDTITVVFRNLCRIPTSVHVHGVFYRKDSEGAPYADGTSGADKADDAVSKGATHTYTWQVPERAGPGPHDGSSVMWMYHSHAAEVGDMYAGLMGPMEITAAGMARADGSPKDVDREVFELFAVMNENSSPYLKANLTRFARRPLPTDPEDEEFEESNLKHSINGFMFGNQPMVVLKKGERVRWYVMGMGTEVDLHTPHWHGNDVVVGGMRMDVVNLLPASMVVADMVPDNVGIWLFHCHVNDHLTAGMLTRYQVVA